MDPTNLLLRTVGRSLEHDELVGYLPRLAHVWPRFETADSNRPPATRPQGRIMEAVGTAMKSAQSTPSCYQPCYQTDRTRPNWQLLRALEQA